MTEFIQTRDRVSTNRPATVRGAHRERENNTSMKTILAITVALTLAAVAGPSRASIITTIAPGTISASAKTADPTLANYSTFDVKVTVGAGDDWTAQDLRVVLTQGSFYVPPALNSNKGQPALWAVPTFANLEYDTFVTAPNFTDPTILGRFSPQGGPGTEIFSNNEVNVSFGDLVNTGPGTYTVARLTVTNNSAGTVSGNAFSALGGATGTAFTGTVPVPEPAAGFVILLISVAAMSRRR
jgi:hypothetical protein